VTRVFLGGQQPDPALEDRGQVEVRAARLHVGLADGQRGGDVAAPGVDGGEQPGRDRGHQGADVELHGQGELDRVHLAPVHQHRHGRLLHDGDLVPGQVHQFRAAGGGQGAPGGTDEVVMGAPAGQQQGVQVDVQQPGGRRGGLAHGRLLGGREQHRGTSRGQRRLQSLGRVRGRAEQQARGGTGASADGRGHGPLSSIVVTAPPPRGSMRTISAGRFPV
jgi:hypothetical protein